MRFTLISMLICLALIAPGMGTTLLHYDLEELTRHADRVFVGVCESSRAELVDGRIYTRLQFSVKEMVKGAPAEEIVLRLPGGEYQGVRLHLVGMPAFTVGEELVLFLTAEDRLTHAWPVGLAQGKFRIEYSQPAGKAHVRRELEGVSLHHAPSASAKKIAPLEQPDGLPLDEFLDKVRGFAGASHDPR